MKTVLPVYYSGVNSKGSGSQKRAQIRSSDEDEETIIANKDGSVGSEKDESEQRKEDRKVPLKDRDSANMEKPGFATYVFIFIFLILAFYFTAVGYFKVEP